MEVPFFSVIIPTLNEEVYLPRLLKDLQNQKDKGFEVIIVDGGSEDGTMKVIEQYKNTITLECIRSKKRNVSFQRNVGGKHAKGKYLIFLDADSRINASFIKNIKRQVHERKGLIFLPYVQPEEKSPEVVAFYQVTNFLVELSQNMGKPFPSVGCMICERTLFELIGGYKEDLYIYEDQEILQNAHKWGVRAKFMPHIKVKYSSRRLKKEGKLRGLYKAIVGTVHVLFKGDVREKIFDYEMGGLRYNHESKKDSFNLDAFKKMYKDLSND